MKIGKLLENNTYPGRGIIVGTSPDGKNAISAYFIMGRSQNSRNRIFIKKDGVLFTNPFDASKVSDPSLIIYPAIKEYENRLIVTNGDQTDTVYDALKSGKSFEYAMSLREFEPDKPNFTPRISGLLTFENGGFSYKLSILKSIDDIGSNTVRYFFDYPSKPGLAHFIHTYKCDGNPIPSFEGEPEIIETDNDISVFSQNVWDALDNDNRISLYVRYTDLESGKANEIIINKNK